MQFYWVQDQVNQKQFHVYWKPGVQNLADYVTKHHTAQHHQAMQHKFLHKINLAYNQLRQAYRLRTPCEGVLIPNYNLAISKQGDTITGTADRRTEDRQASRASQNKHKRV